jgi:hypothetical protein
MRYILLLVGWSFAAGLLIMHISQDCKAEKPPAVVPQQAVLTMPLLPCDATVDQRTKPTQAWTHKCYIKGMRK